MGNVTKIIDTVFNGDRNVFSRIIQGNVAAPVDGTTATAGTWYVCGTGTTPTGIWVYNASAVGTDTTTTDKWVKITR